MADYVSNKEFLQELVNYKQSCRVANAMGLEDPVVTRKIGEALLQICHRLSNSYRFVNYSFKDEMCGDAVLKCLMKVKLFDESVSSNPFAYFTQIAWNSYIGRINIEQHNTSVKARMIANSVVSDHSIHELAEDGESSNAYVEFLRENETYVDYIEQRKQKKNQTGQLHPSLKHRNLTPYKRKTSEVESPVLEQNKKDTDVDLWSLGE